MSGLLENKIYLIGGDVSNSKSRVIHDAIYKSLKFDFSYAPKSFPDKKSLENFLKEKSSKLISNVTYPYKQFCYEYFKSFSFSDEATKYCNACNLIILGKQIYNFDGAGFVKFLSIENIDLAGKNVLICGTGATAHSICFAIKSLANVCFASRKLAPSNASDFKIFDYVKVNELLGSFDIIVDARPTMFEENMLDLSKLNSGAIVIDVSYSDKQTGIINAANKFGIKTYDGKKMLVCQAVLCIKKILEVLKIDNADENDFKTLYNIGAHSIGL